MVLENEPELSKLNDITQHYDLKPDSQSTIPIHTRLKRSQTASVECQF